MPNYVMNKLEVRGKNAHAIMSSKYLDKNNKFDFDKIIPMPQSLHMEEASSAPQYICAYFDENEGKAEEYANKYPDNCSIKNALKYYTSGLTLEDYDFLVEGINRMKNKYNNLKDMKTPEDIGKEYLSNLDQYGCLTWYDWSVKNWGTKWNACDTYVPQDQNKDTFVVTFETAWDAPLPIINKIFEDNPGLFIKYTWAEEQYALYTQEITREANSEDITIIAPEENSEEAIKLWESLWGAYSDYDTGE